MNLTITFPDGIYSGELFLQTPLQLYRKPHDIEIRDYDMEETKGWVYMGDGYRNGPVRDTVLHNPSNPQKRGMPEVYRIYPDHQTPINCDWLWLWRNLNPKLSDKTFCTLLGNGLAWTNNTGFPGRRNCILQEDMSEKDPAFHTPIINGGATLKGIERNGYFFLDSMLISDKVPTAEEVLNKPWLWYYGTTVLANGQVNYITRQGMDGNYYPVRVPILSTRQLYMQLNWLDKLPIGENKIPAIAFA